MSLDLSACSSFSANTRGSLTASEPALSSPNNKSAETRSLIYNQTRCPSSQRFAGTPGISPKRVERVKELGRVRSRIAPETGPFLLSITAFWAERILLAIVVVLNTSFRDGWTRLCAPPSTSSLASRSTPKFRPTPTSPSYSSKATNTLSRTVFSASRISCAGIWNCDSDCWRKDTYASLERFGSIALYRLPAS